jgi:prepilin-type N-terminal cleavage/methylation domain-containing protein
MLKKILNNSRKGFTLIELLLYLSLSAIIIFITTMFLMTLLEVRVKNQTIATVDQEGNQTMSLITQSIRNATTINSPVIGAQDSTLSLTTGVAGKDPTIFTLSGGAITMTEGVNPPVPLTSNLVVISNLNFRNLSRPNTPGNVDITFTVDHIH